MSISKQDIIYVANLARVELSETEVDKFSHQLQDIIGFIDSLKKADVENISPTSHILPLHNVLRNDCSCNTFSSEQALANAPQRQGNFFKVPKIIE
jgi:aspartyl-tRNA(Asn)/glutamyl-tRNA(Gln) amidotransferase subunit C